ncbi:MAG: GGDEF domain-containing protein [archaeon]
MKKKGDRLSALRPEVRKKISDLLQDIDKSIDVLYEIATTDEKTGLYNYQYFKAHFSQEFEKAKRGQSLSLLILDLDKFKKLNDTYGHITGDRILEHLGKLLRKQTRKADIAARFGGEEFIIIFPNTSLEKAYKVSERIRKAVEGDKLIKKYKLTISGGVTCYKKDDTISKIKQRADKALYKAKEGGRNFIEAS